MAGNLMCTRCDLPLKKRQTKPATATEDGHLYFDYYQCPKCKVDYAVDKNRPHELITETYRRSRFLKE